MKWFAGFLARAFATLPSVGVVMFFDSLSKEAYGLPLYFGTGAGGIALSYAIGYLGGRTKEDESPDPLVGCGASFLTTGIVAVGVVCWLILSGH